MSCLIIQSNCTSQETFNSPADILLPPSTVLRDYNALAASSYTTTQQIMGKWNSPPAAPPSKRLAKAIRGRDFSAQHDDRVVTADDMRAFSIAQTREWIRVVLTHLGGFDDLHARRCMMQWDDPGSIMLQNVRRNDLVLAFGQDVAAVLMHELIQVRKRTVDVECRRQMETDDWLRERSMVLE